jgi:ubiquinone/menaquinone biosynthesis C-methylase UbiE
VTGVRTSRSFDRAADFYDRTRSLPADAMAEIIPMLAHQLAGKGPCLEIGVGTGRFALPLHEAGVAMTGIDLSRPMMAVLVDKAGGQLPFPLAMADATQLPFPSDAFGAGIACHVLHLIPDWPVAVAELVRVIRPGGVILIDRGGETKDAFIDQVRRKFMAEAGIQRRHLGADGARADVEGALVSRGATVERLPTVVARSTTTAAALIDELEANCFSWTWPLDDRTRLRAAQRTRVWVGDELGSLNESQRVEVRINWRAYHLP